MTINQFKQRYCGNESFTIYVTDSNYSRLNTFNIKAMNFEEALSICIDRFAICFSPTQEINIDPEAEPNTFRLNGFSIGVKGEEPKYRIRIEKDEW